VVRGIMQTPDRPVEEERQDRSARGMKVTTIRVGEDLWALLESEAQHAAVSVSQYIREAALARAAFAAGTRAELPGELLARWAQSAVAPEGHGRIPDHDTERLIAALNRTLARQQHEESEALRAESQQRQRHARDLVQRTDELLDSDGED
jgi:hypothetical protein